MNPPAPKRPRQGSDDIQPLHAHPIARIHEQHALHHHQHQQQHAYQQWPASPMLKTGSPTDPSSDPYAYAVAAASTPSNAPSTATPPASRRTPPSANNSHKSQGQSSSSFRNVSACNRCRLRKNRCDQNLPACSACEKAGVKCVGFDPITKREIPRSYVYYLESRTTYLESLLQDNGVPYTSAESFALEGSNVAHQPTASADHSHKSDQRPDAANRNASPASAALSARQEEEKTLDKLVSDVGLVTVQGASDSRYLGSTSGISFARVVFAAVKSTVSRSRPGSEAGGRRMSLRAAPAAAAAAAAGNPSLRDSFFGLHHKGTIKEAPFPDRELGTHLVDLYFEHANPQIPILHRVEFMRLFESVYTEGHKRSPRESYILNIVFAIGAGVILDLPNKDRRHSSFVDASKYNQPRDEDGSLRQAQAEEYHAAAIIHLEGFLASTTANVDGWGSGGGLEELQAVLLLASFALLRPVAPGLWYIVGVAVRLAVDLGLHYEEGSAINPDAPKDTQYLSAPSMNHRRGSVVDPKERGRREWVRDLRRRLWWCTYTVDRLVSSCVGRPFGITDQVVTTEFPSTLDDKFITGDGFQTSAGMAAPSYKFVSHHYFRLRLLQSEVMQVLQYKHAQHVRQASGATPNPFMHTQLPSPFLAKYTTFKEWRADVDRRLYEWKESAPGAQDIGVQFHPSFLELNYWQAVVMLFRHSLTTPGALAGEAAYGDGGVSGQANPPADEDSEDEEFVYLKTAEAGQKVLKLYRQLHRYRLVSYTFLATHHLFMAGIAFLYAIWHSVAVRSHLSLDDVDFTVLAAISVLEDLSLKCPPAEVCRDAFNRMAKATITMCMSSTGFGEQAKAHLDAAKPKEPKQEKAGSSPGTSRANAGKSKGQTARPAPKFDMNLRDLFTEEETTARPFGNLNTTEWVRQGRRFSQQIDPKQAVPPQMATAVMAPPPVPIQAQQQQMGNIDPSLQAGAYSQPPEIYAAMPPQQPTFAAVGDMDFLDNFATGTGDFAAQMPEGMSVENFPFPIFDMQGFEGQHDWSEGVQMDIFDGYFFGGNAPT